MKTLQEFVLTGNLLIAAHRGASGLAPENTIAAFDLAVKEGANMIETDIHFTSDGHIVAFHDFEHLQKSNNDFNSENFTTLEQIKKIDVGEWFGSEFTGERVPTLQEILEFAKNKTYLNFEIKTNHIQLDEKNINNLIGIINESGMKDYLMFSSFNYGLIKKIKSYDKSLPTAAINIPNSKRLPSEIAKETGAEAFICALEELNDEINQDSIENNIFLAVYSVDTEEHLEFIKQFNIKALGTNYPAKIRKLINV